MRTPRRRRAAEAVAPATGKTGDVLQRWQGLGETSSTGTCRKTGRNGTELVAGDGSNPDPGGRGGSRDKRVQGGSARRCCKEVSGAMAVREEAALSRLVGWSLKQRRQGLGAGQRWTRSSDGTRLGESLAPEMMMERHVGGGPGVEDDVSVHSHGGADAEPELLVSEASWTPWRASAREKEREPDVRER